MRRKSGLEEQVVSVPIQEVKERLSPKKEVLGSFAMTFLWVNYEEKLETNICFEEAYERFHTGMLRGNIKYRNNKKEVEVPVCDT